MDLKNTLLGKLQDVSSVFNFLTFSPFASYFKFFASKGTILPNHKYDFFVPLILLLIPNLERSAWYIITGRCENNYDMSADNDSM